MKLSINNVFNDAKASAKYEGFVDKTFEFLQEFQLLRPELWRRFVYQFKTDADFDAGWRGEYWGKMMRGAALVYDYTKNEKLYEVLKETVEDMLSSADEDGRISSYAKDHEFDGWDIWCRKYVLLGMQYYLEICKEEELKNEIVTSMKKQVDYIISKIGDGEGKKQITEATRHWRGLNSSSVLEPVVRLYLLTKEEKYLDFASYIVDCGGIDVANIFDLAYENEFYPYQYPVTKAYEMISCFEGLLEYYKITGNEKYKTAIINFADRILESDFTVIGCSGCTSEYFDHSVVRQANTTNYKVMQETCVTVTLMKFFYRIHLLTGNPKYVDAFEISLYNAYLGSINTEKAVSTEYIKSHPESKPEWLAEALPFDSYSPLVAGVRGVGIGGFKIMSDSHHYGCCACIGCVGIGILPRIQLLNKENGIVLNMFVPGSLKTKTPSGKDATFNIKTEYPKSGKVNIAVETEDDEKFELMIRNPGWSKNTNVCVNGESVHITEGYITLKNVKGQDIIEIELDMRTEAIYPIPYGTQILMNKPIWGHNYMVQTFDREDPIAKNHIALRRGPVMLAQDNRLGYSVDDAVSIKVNSDGYVDAETTEEIPYNAILGVNVPLSDGGYIKLTDYSSAGKLWNEESKMAVWILTK